MGGLREELIHNILREQRTLDIELEEYEAMDEGCELDHSIAIGWSEALNWMLKQIREISEKQESQ